MSIPTQKYSYVTPSAVALLITNLVVLLQAIVMHWNISTMIWTYWMQSLVIVLIAMAVAKYKLAWVFLLGLLSFYGLFLLTMTFPTDSINYSIDGQRVSAETFTILKDVIWPAVALGTVFFLCNHLFSYYVDRKNSHEARSFGRVVLRILPLHLIILLAGFIPAPVVVFMILKIAVDLGAHAIQHETIRSRIQKPKELKPRRRV